MQCLMCERKYSEEYGDRVEGFCSEPCRHVYEHLYGAKEPCETKPLKSAKSVRTRKAARARA